jgi:hypothetical protein
LSIWSGISVVNDPDGSSLTTEMILKFCENHHFEQIPIGMESTFMYSFHPSMFFHEDEELKRLTVLAVIDKNPF